MAKDTFENEANIILDETDYLNYVSKSSTKRQRRKFDIGDIYINGVICLKCKDYIRSKHRHDFKYCKCGSIAVDGGSWYCKRSGDLENYVNIIENFYED